MKPATTGVATMRHVGLVAIEALLVAVIVWIAAMTLAGATQSDLGVGGGADAGRTVSLTVADGRFGGTTIAHANPAGTGTWIHATCLQDASIVMVQWVRVGEDSRATLVLGSTPAWKGGPAACTAEEGYFGGNSRWRVLSTASFSVAP